jgi:hypothetical protein
LERSIVIISSDHGEILAEDGTTFGHPPNVTPDELYHVPLIMAGPGIPGQRRIGELSQNIDIVPTLLELLGLEAAAEHHGHSQAAAIRKESSQPTHDYVVSRSAWGGGEIYMLRDLAVKYVHRENGDDEPIEELWRVPDRLAAASEALPSTESTLEIMRGRLRDDVLPLRRAYEALPLDDRRVFVSSLPLQAGRVIGLSPEGAIVQGETAGANSDGRWSVGANRIESCAFSEDAPPLTLRLQVPNGRYRVWMDVTARPRQQGAEGYASAMRVRAQHESEFRTLRHMASRDGGSDFQALGVHTVADGVFEVTLDEGDPTLFATTRGRFVFEPEADQSGDDGVLDHLSRSLERLRALGYVE